MNNDKLISVALQGLEKRGEANARKRIYMSAMTPDLYAEHYRPKVRAFLADLFSAENEGVPLMERYYKAYWDLYWDLHSGCAATISPMRCARSATASTR